MSRCSSPDQCKSGKDFQRCAEKNGLVTRQGAGSHIIVYHPQGKEYGAMTIPVHGDKQLGKGIRAKIAKWFISVGIGGLVLMLVAGGGW